MTPAQQRLAGRDPPGFQVHQRLEVQLELLVDERLAQVDFQRTARLDDLGHLLAEEAERAAPVRLRPVEGEVGVLEQIVGSHRSRCDGDADAGADLDQMMLDLVALAQPFDDPPREFGGIFQRRDVALEHDEFVAAETGDIVLGAEDRPQTIGHRAEQAVAGRVAEGVVDLLELIEIDEQQGRYFIGFFGS